MGKIIATIEKPLTTHFYYFSKDFDVSEDVKAFVVSSFGDSRYQLFVNGTLACEGPCQGSEFVNYYEETDIAALLVKGKNAIVAKVLHLEDDQFVSVYRLSRPAFWLEGTMVTAGGEQIDIGTDETWKCERDDSVKFHNTPGIHTSTPPMEDHLAPLPLVSVGVETIAEPILANGCYDVFGCAQKYRLEKRPVPQMETLEPDKMELAKKGENFLLYDSIVYTTAKVKLTFKAKKGSVIKITYAECFYEDGKGKKNLRDCYDKRGATLAHHVTESVVATGEEQVFEPFWYRAFRFIRLDFEKNADLQVIDFESYSYFYPLGDAGSFECNDDKLNEMWDISKNTVLCCSHEMYVDCPFFEQQQYDMDSYLEMMFTFRLSDDYRLPMKSIMDLGASQLPDGFLQANYPSINTQVIPGFTLFWIFMVREAIRYTVNTQEKLNEFKQFLGTINKALMAFENIMDERGLVGPTKYWPFIDWVPGWEIGIPNGGREEPLTVYSLLYAKALNDASEIYDAFGNIAMKDMYAKRALEISSNVRKYCFDDEAKLFRNTPSRKEFSEHTTIWAVLSGTVSGKDAEELVERTFDGKHEVSHASFSMNHFVLRALEKTGKYKFAPKIFKGWEHMMDMHCTTWCENPDDPRSECHGWSSAPIYEFSSMVLGVKPLENGFKKVTVTPTGAVFGITSANGTVPTPFGILEVSWKKVGDAIQLTVVNPAPDKMEII